MWNVVRYVLSSVSGLRSARLHTKLNLPALRLINHFFIKSYLSVIASYKQSFLVTIKASSRIMLYGISDGFMLIYSINFDMVAMLLFRGRLKHASHVVSYSPKMVTSLRRQLPMVMMQFPQARPLGMQNWQIKINWYGSWSLNLHRQNLLWSSPSARIKICFTS